jgi:hypothetical protein
MSTRCNIHFHGFDRTLSNIYRHSDGYPEGVLPDLQRFFEAVRAATPDTRFSSGEQLAARYLVWQAIELAVDYDFSSGEMKTTPKASPLDFLGVSPCLEDHGDIEYVYKVDCDNLDDNGFPTVSVEPC